MKRLAICCVNDEEKDILWNRKIQEDCEFFRERGRGSFFRQNIISSHSNFYYGPRENKVISLREYFETTKTNGILS